jgi:superfamily II DNA or RNA helicase
MTFALRPYQTDIITETRAALSRGVRSVLIQSPTGSGKTALTAFMLGTARSRGKRAWFIVHRRELIKQSAKTFDLAATPHGIISAGFLPRPSELIQVASIQTLTRRLTAIQPPDLIVWDECHHCASTSWAQTQAAFPKALHIGLTATPERLDGRGLIDHFDVMIKGPDVRWLIDQGFLSEYRYYAPSTVQLVGVNPIAGDFNKKSLGAAMDQPTITGDAVQHYLRLARGKRAVVFAVNRIHSQRAVSQFLAAGVPAEHVDGETPTEQRDAAIDRFARGQTLILSNVDLFGEGFDLPAIEAVILLRPTQSLGLYLQQVGRALRPSPGKEHAIILDHAGNVARHGMPDDPRDWTLDAKPRAKRGKSDPTLSVRMCPKCYAAMPSGKPVCVVCGHIFEVEQREITEADGDLQEVTKEQIEQMRRSRFKEQAQARTVEELEQIGRARGYKSPRRWAEAVMAGRRARRIAS